MNINIFYSWQSDIANKHNRGFIQDCLEKAIKELEGSKYFSIEIRLDKATQGIEGAPDIANTIFEKIKQCHLFVADISIINLNCGEEFRKVPNPNVLVELGYAASILGWDKILLLYNLGYGGIQHLPFDLKMRRPIFYSLNETNLDDKQTQKNILTKQLVGAINEISSNLRFFENEITTKLYPYYHAKISEIAAESEDLLLNLFQFSGTNNLLDSDDEVFPPHAQNIYSMTRELNKFLSEAEWDEDAKKSYRDYNSSEIIGYFQSSFKKIKKYIKNILKFKEGLSNNTLLLIYKIATIIDIKKYYIESGNVYYGQDDRQLILYTANFSSEKILEFMTSAYELKKVFIESHQLHKEEFFRQQRELFTRN